MTSYRISEDLDGNSNVSGRIGLVDGLREREEQKREPDDEDKQRQKQASQAILYDRPSFHATLHRAILSIYKSIVHSILFSYFQNSTKLF